MELSSTSGSHAGPAQVALLDSIDLEMDRLLDLAIALTWTSREFRTERDELGRMTAGCISRFARPHVKRESRSSPFGRVRHGYGDEEAEP